MTLTLALRTALTGLSATQPLVAISSGESEFAAQVRGIIEGVFILQFGPVL